MKINFGTLSDDFHLNFEQIKEFLRYNILTFLTPPNRSVQKNHKNIFIFS